MKTLYAALGLGSITALAIACGASSRQAAPMTASPMHADGQPAGDRHAEVEALDNQIVAEMAKLDLPVQAGSSLVCQPDMTCTAETMAAGIELPSKDPACTPGKTEVCSDACTFADSICTNADKICTIAGELGGRDQFANDKCDSGKTSCTASSKRCCSCI